MRACSRCHFRRSRADFYTHKNGRKRGVCKPCFREETRQNRALFKKAYPKRVMMLAARKRAQQAHVPFAITEEDFEIPERCPVLGLCLESRRGRRGPIDSSPTLDRIVPGLGYVRGNVVVVSWRANRLKSDATLEELTRIIDWYGRGRPREALNVRPSVLEPR
jgi:hypothetical protein